MKSIKNFRNTPTVIKRVGFVSGDFYLLLKKGFDQLELKHCNCKFLPLHSSFISSLGIQWFNQFQLEILQNKLINFVCHTNPYFLRVNVNEASFSFFICPPLVKNQKSNWNGSYAKFCAWFPYIFLLKSIILMFLLFALTTNLRNFF